MRNLGLIAIVGARAGEVLNVLASGLG